MRVMLILSLPYPAAPGGGERWMLEAGKALSRRVEVGLHYLIGPGMSAPTIDVGQDTQLEVQHHQCRVPTGGLGQRLAIPRGLIRAGSAVDVVHINQFGSMTTQLMG